MDMNTTRISVIFAAAAVAAWAEQPSEAVHAETSAAVLEAFEDDLDTPRALQVLRRLEKDATVPDGAKFETFAWGDALLGLDLVRQVGQPVVAAELPAGAQALLDEVRANRRDGGDAVRLHKRLARRMR